MVARHCEQCRRTSGHFVAATAMRRAHFTLLEQRGLKWFEAVPGFRRGFCDQCGSSLFFEELGGERISIAAGSLDNSEGLAIAAHIYTSECGSYYEITGAAQMLPAAGHSVPLP